MQILRPEAGLWMTPGIILLHYPAESQRSSLWVSICWFPSDSGDERRKPLHSGFPVQKAGRHLAAPVCCCGKLPVILPSLRVIFFLQPSRCGPNRRRLPGKDRKEGRNPSKTALNITLCLFDVPESGKCDSHNESIIEDIIVNICFSIK